VIEDDRSGPAEAPTPGTSAGPSFRTRLTVALIASAVIPLVGFGIVVLLIGPSFDADADDGTVARSTLIFAIAVVAAIAIVTSYVLASELTAPLRAIARSVDRVSAGDRSSPIVVAGDD
jgi:methyl-accepting chemotaxis protein